MKSMIENAITNIDDKYIDEALIFMKNEKSKKDIVLFMAKRLVACAAVMVLLVFGGLEMVVASGNIAAYEILYSLQPYLAMKLAPVNESCVDQGIKMSVEAIRVEDNKADIYIEIQDLDGDRLDESVDLFDSYNIHTNASTAGGCTFLSYDEKKKAATFLITVQQDKKISGKYMVFTISKLLAGKQNTSVELPEILSAKEVKVLKNSNSVELRGGSFENAKVSILEYNGNQYRQLTECVDLTAFGYIDNALHIQVYYHDILKYDNHGFIYLTNQDNEVLSPYDNFSFWDAKREGSYEEYIYNIEPEELQNYRILGDFTTSDTLIEGNWRVEFPIINKAK